MKEYINVYRIAFLLLLCFQSCKNEIKQESYNKIEIKYTTKKDRAKLSSIVEDINYITLETSKEILLGSIEKIEVSDKIYCLQSKKINVFDLSGKSLFEIDHQGSKGPEGYNKINEFRVDSANRIIEIWDRLSRKMIYYDYNTGEYIRSQLYYCDAYSFIKDQKEDYYFYTATQPNQRIIGATSDIYYILKFDKKGKFKEKYLNVENNISLISNGYSILYKYNNSIFFNPPGENTVYQYKNDVFQEKYYLDFGKYNIKLDEFKDMKRWGLAELMNHPDFAWNPGMFREYYQGYSYVYCFGQATTYSGFISKSSGNHIISHTDLINDFDGGWPIRIQCVQDEIFICCFDAYVIKGYYDDLRKQLSSKDWNRFKNKHRKFNNAVKNLNINSNPVIAIMSPKEF